MSTGKCHRGVTWSCDSWWNPAILLNLSMLCWSIYNSCLKSLVSSKIIFFVIVQRGISKTSLKALDVVLLSTSDSLKLYQFTTQVAPPFSEQYLQEGFWQLTEYLIEDQEIHCKKPTWSYSGGFLFCKTSLPQLKAQRISALLGVMWVPSQFMKHKPLLMEQDVNWHWSKYCQFYFH